MDVEIEQQTAAASADSQLRTMQIQEGLVDSQNGIGLGQGTGH